MANFLLLSFTAQAKLLVLAQSLPQKSQLAWHCYVCQAGLELLILLCQRPECHHV